MTDALTHVAFDVETTGLDATGAVTVVGGESDFGCRAWYQPGGSDTASDAV